MNLFAVFLLFPLLIERLSVDNGQRFSSPRTARRNFNKFLSKLISIFDNNNNNNKQQENQDLTAGDETIQRAESFAFVVKIRQLTNVLETLIPAHGFDVVCSWS